MSLPTKSAQERWTTVNQNDYLQLVDENHGGAILAWINYLGQLEGAFAFGGDLPDLNGIFFVDGNKYTTIQSAINAAIAEGGGDVIVPPAYRETITQTLLIGSATTRVTLHLCTNVVVTINITNATNGVLVYKGSGISGWGQPDGNSDLSKGGCVFQLHTGAHVSNIIATPGSTDNNYTALFEKFRIDANAANGAIVDNACLYLLDMLNLSPVKDLLVSNFTNAIGVLVTADNYTSGPLTLDNLWVQGGEFAGARPVVITGGASAGTHGNQTISIQGGVINGSGAGLANLEINGFGNTNNAVNNITVIGTYLESNGSASDIGIQIIDSSNVTLIGCQTSMFAGGVGVDISQTGSALTRGIQLIGYRLVATSAIGIYNHITSEQVGTSTVTIAGYTFGEADHTGIRRTIGPVNSSPNAVQIGLYNASNNNAADLVIQASVPGTRSPLLVINRANQSLLCNFDSGLNATQETQLRFLDQGTSEWVLRKTNANAFSIQDDVNNFNRLLLIQAGATNLNAGAGANTVTINQTTNSGTTGFAVYSGGATPLLQASLTSNGLIIENAAATHIVGQIAQSGRATFRNFVDSSLFVTLDGGTSAAQDVYVAFADRGTDVWRLRKDSSAELVLSDITNTVNRWIVPQVAAISTSGVFNFANTEKLAWRNAANNADLSVAYNASNVFVISGNANAPIFDATTGFRVNGAATSTHVLRGNGTNFIDAALAASDLSNGVTGSGAVMLAASPTTSGTLTAAIINASGIVTAPTLIEATLHTPSSAGDTGTTGQIAWDASFIYQCTNTNTWKRVAIATW